MANMHEVLHNWAAQRRTDHVLTIGACPAFDALDVDLQDDLIEWYNVSQLDQQDYARLAYLAHQGQFFAYECADCGERVRIGQSLDWAHFQGVCQGEGYEQLCADCYGHFARLAELAGISI